MHHPHSAFRTDGFRTFRRDRLAGRSGGVAVLVGEQYGVEELNFADDDRLLELLWVKVTLSNIVFCFFGALYYQPKHIYNKSNLLARLEMTVEAIMIADLEAITALGGDFNKLEVREVEQSTRLTPVVSTPTRSPPQSPFAGGPYTSTPLFSGTSNVQTSIHASHATTRKRPRIQFYDDAVARRDKVYALRRVTITSADAYS